MKPLPKGGERSGNARTSNAAPAEQKSGWGAAAAGLQGALGGGAVEGVTSLIVSGKMDTDSSMRTPGVCIMNGENIREEEYIYLKW